MSDSPIIARIEQFSMALMFIGIAAVFIVPPLMATDYPVRQGSFQAEVLSSASGMGMAVRPVIRARVRDDTGRIFWIRVPSTIIVAPGSPLVIETWCETMTFQSCTARYQRAGELS